MSIALAAVPTTRLDLAISMGRPPHNHRTTTDLYHHITALYHITALHHMSTALNLTTTGPYLTTMGQHHTIRTVRRIPAAPATGAT